MEKNANICSNGKQGDIKGLNNANNINCVNNMGKKVDFTCFGETGECIYIGYII